MNLSCYFVEFGGKTFNGRLHKENVWQAALRGFAMNSLGDFLQGPTVGVDTDEELPRLATRGVVNKETVSGPDVYDDSALVTLVGSNQLLESSLVNLSEGFTAD